MYKLDFWLARSTPGDLATIGLIVLLAVVGSTGCATTSTTPPPDDVGEMSPAEVLHEAAISVFRERGLGVELESSRFLVVNSDFHEISEDLRRRYTARVIRGPEGAMGLKVIAEYQRRLELGGETSWKAIDTDELRERARSTELELGRAIERRFERWSEQSSN